MLKLIGTTVAAVAIMLATQATTEAAGPGGCANAVPVYQAGPAYQASAPTGYRSYSYQPGTSAYGAGMMRSSSSRSSYLDASSKALGRYGK